MTKSEAGISRMNLEHLKTFHVVASLGSFTEASKVLFLSQPAVSQQIQGLEHALKNPLFDRGKRQIRLTARGKILFNHTQRLFGIFKEIENVFNDLNHLQTGELTIAASAVMGNYFLPELIAEFSKTYPLINIRLEMGDSAYVTSLVEKGSADLALSRHVEGLKNCRQELFSKEPYVCVCAPAFPLAAHKKAVSAEEFGKNYLVMRQRGSRMRSKIEEWFASVGASEYLSSPQVEVNSLESSKHLIERGLGMAAFPLVAVKEELKQGKLLEVHVKDFFVTADYFLGVNPGQDLSPAALKFFTLLKGQVSKTEE